MAYTIQRGDTLSAIARKNGVTVQQLLDANPDIDDPNLIYAGATLNIPGEDDPNVGDGDSQVADDRGAFAEGTDQGGGVTTTPGSENESPAEGSVGGRTETTVSILTSRNMGWYFDSESGNWYVSYALPNSDRSVFFEASGSQLDAIFGEGQRPTNYLTTTLGDLTADGSMFFSGNVSEVQGTGTFESEVERVISLAMGQGGLPQWAMDDPAVYDFLYVAHMEDKSTDWLIEQISGLDSFKARFPGIEALKQVGLTTPEAVTGYLEFESGVKQIAMRDGASPETVTPQMVGDMLSKGQSLEDVQFTYEVFNTMERNQGAMDAFNEILVARGQQPLDPDSQFDFLAGNAPQELYEIWEEASLNRAAQDAGLAISPTEAIDLARRTEGFTSYGAAYEGLTAAAQNILRFRSEIALDKYGINQDDLIDLAMGVAPSSGVPQAELARNIERAVSAARAQRQRERVNPFTAFSPDGTAQQASLSRARQES